MSIKHRIKSGFHLICCLDICHTGPKRTTKANFNQNSKWVLMCCNEKDSPEKKWSLSQPKGIFTLNYVGLHHFSFASDGCHTDLVCQPVCCYWCHPFSYCRGPFKISRNQQGSSIFPFSMTPSIMNCNFSFPAGLTLTLRWRQWMGIRALTSFKLTLSVFTAA